MANVVTMITMSILSTNDAQGTGDDDNKETNIVVPITVNPIFQILQQNNVASMDSSGDDDDSESDVRQQCVSEINKYKQYKSKIPTNGDYPDALAWWKKSAVINSCLALLAKQYLSRQAAAAPSERIFSKASRIIEEQ